MLETLLLALALSADAFSVALGIGATYSSAAAHFRVATVFGGFQFLFAFVGWQTGATILPYISPWDRYVAATALLVIAGKMLWESFERHEANAPRRVDPTRGFSLIVVGVAVSIDALAAGVAVRTLQEFLAFFRWDEDRSGQQLIRLVAGEHGPRAAIGALDASGHRNQGGKTPGVPRQWCG